MRKAFFLPALLFLFGAGCQAAVPFQIRDKATCSYYGIRYDSGDSFKSDDGCNLCTCTDSGAIACTQRACANVPAPVAAQCQTAADCNGQNLDAGFCDNGQWACNQHMCEFQCAVSSKP